MAIWVETEGSCSNQHSLTQLSTVAQWYICCLIHDVSTHQLECRESLGKPEQVMFVLGIAVVIDSSNYTNHKQMKVIKGHIYRLTKSKLRYWYMHNTVSLCHYCTVLLYEQYMCLGMQRHIHITQVVINNTSMFFTGNCMLAAMFMLQCQNNWILQQG
jgi:hypothetical protein